MIFHALLVGHERASKFRYIHSSKSQHWKANSESFQLPRKFPGQKENKVEKKDGTQEMQGELLNFENTTQLDGIIPLVKNFHAIIPRTPSEEDCKTVFFNTLPLLISIHGILIVGILKILN